MWYFLSTVFKKESIIILGLLLFRENMSAICTRSPKYRNKTQWVTLLIKNSLFCIKKFLEFKKYLDQYFNW